MERSKIPCSSKSKPLQTMLPVAKSAGRVLQPILPLNKPQEDPGPKTFPARRMLSRRSKSFSDLRPTTEPVWKKLSSASKPAIIKPLLKATSTSNLSGKETKRPLFKNTLKPIQETSKGAINKQPNITARSTVKRPAAAGSDDAAKAKIAKGPRIAPYDYKARYNFLNEKHTLLVGSYKELKQKLVDTEKDLEDYGELKKNHLELCGRYDNVLEGQAQFEMVKKNLDELRAAHVELEVNFETLTAKNEKNRNDVKRLEKVNSNLVMELEGYNLLKENHAELTLNHIKLQEEHGKLIKEKQEVEADLLKTIETNRFLNEQLDEYKMCLQSHEELRRNMHNEIQDLKGTIRVFCRVRAFRPDEQEKMLCNISCVDETTLEIKKCKESISCISGKATDLKLDFNFDKVFPPEATQLEVFEELSQLVQSALDGYHVCVFAYGQTGSGKTYTMQGENGKEYSGMIPRTVRRIFELIRNLEKIGWVYAVEASFLEIYNENIRDLLDPKNKKEHDIRFNEGKGTTVTNLTHKKVETFGELIELMAVANKNRAVAATNYNEHSSRSHSVTKVTLTGVNKEMRISYVGSLSLVDLAGSESAKTSSAERITETKNINKSLSTLGTVMTALHNKEHHIPYRNSKLTYLLQSCLGGNSKTLMFVNIAPFEECYGESVSSLRFAAKVKEVKIGSKRNKMYLQRELSNM